MLGRLTHWLTAKLDGSDKEDDHLRQRFDALTRLKKTTMDLLQLDTERAMEQAASGAPGADSDSIKNKPRFTDDDTIVHDLGSSLEQCLRLGLRNQSDVSLWNVLYSSSLVLDEPTLVHAIQLAATLADSDSGKARCWIKIALNNHTLESSLMIIFSMACEQVVRMNYEEWSLMRCTEGLDIFLQLVIDIRDVRFAITVNGEPFRQTLPKEIATIPITVADGVTASSDGDNVVTPSADTGVLPSPPPPSSSATLSLLSPAAEDVSVSAEKFGPAEVGALLAPDEEFVEVSAVVFPHRHKGIKPWQFVFGVSLAYLSKNPYHSRFALIDPVLALPNVVQDCVDVLYEYPDTPRLFRTTVLNVTVSQLREMVETTGSLPPDLDAHGAGALLLDFFKNLPEPLLTAEKYDAFVASGRLKDEEASVRNITCLVQELPPYCKYVLEKVIGVIHFLQLPEHAEKNGLDISLAASMLAPVIAFKSEPTVVGTTGQRKMSHTQYHDVRFAAVGAQVVERMIQHQEVIFQDVRSHVSDALERLETKKKALLSIYQLYKMQPQVNFVADRTMLEEISEAFVESVQTREPSSQSPPNNSSDRIPPPPVTRKTTSSFKHRASSPSLYDGTLPLAVSTGSDNLRTGSGNLSGRRQTVSAAPLQPLMSVSEDSDQRIVDAWHKHGFNRPTILGNFEKGGVLLLRSIAYLVKHDALLLEKLYERARPTLSASYDAGLVASAICKSLLHLLKLVPAPEHPSINIVALSAEPFWELFDEESYFFKLFHIMLQMFDHIWGSLPADEASFTRVFCDTEAKLDELLKKSPSSVEDLRCEWEEMWRQISEEDDGSTEEETTAISSGHPSPPRFCKKPSFAFKPEDYKTKLLNPSHILTLDHIAYIDHALPMTCQLCRWFLLYSTEIHGSSLHSLLVLAKNQSPTLIVVKDDQGNVFGGFGSDEWRRATQYFGNGETFIFSFAPRAGSTQADGADPGANFVKYGWSRRNNYFMLCSEESLVMGGGGNFGLYLDSDLSHGTTGPCETFSSRPLVSSQEFNCVQVELWGFTTGDKRPVASRDRKKRSVLD
ncbi:hypothetical protein PINS_up008079 [Pythium insidiosum]|nr:hypothetical protein PINS_up008079 [Pythium insidiosum]